MINIKEKTTKISASLLLVAAALVMSSSGTAQITVENTTNATVTVNVTSKVAVDISPSDLSYGTNSQTLDPGTNVLKSDGSVVGNQVGVMEVENIGSENITQIWLNATTPSDSPFGTGLPQEYDAGNFIEVKRTGERYSGASSDSEFTYINRQEFNETGDLSYVFTPDDGGEWKYGRFRVGDQEIFWAVNSTGGTCETDGTGDTGGDLRVGERAHNKTDTGSTDFTDSSEFTGYGLSTGNFGDAQALATDVTLNIPEINNRQYDVLVECGDPAYTLRTKYNVNALGSNDLSADGSTASLLLDAGPQSEELQPGEYFGINTSIRVPQGVPSGSDGSITGKMRVLVNNVGT